LVFSLPSLADGVGDVVDASDASAAVHLDRDDVDAPLAAM
jgi:hypothetical protein